MIESSNALSCGLATRKGVKRLETQMLCRWDTSSLTQATGGCILHGKHAHMPTPPTHLQQQILPGKPKKRTTLEEVSY